MRGRSKSIIFLAFLFLTCKNEETQIKDSQVSIKTHVVQGIVFPKVMKDSGDIASISIDTNEQVMSKGDIVYFSHDFFDNNNWLKTMDDTNEFLLLVDTNQTFGSPIFSSSFDYFNKDFKPTYVNFYPTFLINLSDSTQRVQVQDGDLLMLQEALDSNGIWKPIEFWRRSWCGNSYYYKELSENGYFVSGVIQYQGDFKTICRVKALINNEIYYSNTYYANINFGQMELASEPLRDYFDKK